MFDVKLQFGIKKVSLKTKTKDGVSSRTMRVVFERDFDDVIAAGLGGDARGARAALLGGGMESCVLPIDSIDASGTLSAGFGEVCDIARMTGVVAKGHADPEGEFPPSIAVEFDLPYDRRAWTFFGDYQNTTATVELTRRQLEIAGARPAGTVAAAVQAFRDSIPEGTSVSVRVGDGKPVTLVDKKKRGGAS